MEVEREREGDEDGRRFGLAKQLAHNDVRVRARAIKSVRKWLGRKGDVSAGDMDKVWMGLYYCMWMSDKRPVQFELSQRLAQLVHELPPDRANLFVASFCKILLRQWTGIDRLRLDKFMMFVRHVFHESVAYLHRHDWQPALVRRWANIFTFGATSTDAVSIERAAAAGPDTTGILAANAPRNHGLLFHVLDVALEELESVLSADGSRAMSFCALRLFLEPFFALMATTRDATVAARCKKCVCVPLEAAAYESVSASNEAGEENNEEGGASDGALMLPSLAAVVRGNVKELTSILLEYGSAREAVDRRRGLFYDLRKKLLVVSKLEEPEEPPRAQKRARDDADGEGSAEKGEEGNNGVEEEEAEKAETTKKKKKKRKKKQQKKEEAEEKETPTAMVVEKEEEEEEEGDGEGVEKRKRRKKKRRSVTFRGKEVKEFSKLSPPAAVGDGRTPSLTAGNSDSLRGLLKKKKKKEKKKQKKE